MSQEERVTAARSLGAKYRTRAIEVVVQFAEQAHTVATLEGPVNCQAGDAIVTGVVGERWPVPAAEFDKRYEPAEGQAARTPGKYRKKIRHVRAMQLTGPLDIELSDGRGRLHGAEGDWYVWDEDVNESIVGLEIFPKSYELESIPVYVSLDAALPSTQRDEVLHAVDAMRPLLPNTRVAIFDERVEAQSQVPVWFRIVGQPVRKTHGVPKVVDLPVDAVVDQDGLLAQIREAKTESVGKYTSGKLRTALGLLRQRDPEEQDELMAIIAAQLTEVDHFNYLLANESKLEIDGSNFLEKCDPALEPPGLASIGWIGAWADYYAALHQERWQRLVLATTKEIAAPFDPVLKNGAALGPGIWFSAAIGLVKCLLHPTLVTLGLLAALGLASFTELSGGCEAEDPFVFLGCSSEAWKHWFGPVSFFVAYIGVLIWAWCRYAPAKAQKWEARHQDYRLLAECLRVLYVRQLLGRAACVGRDLPPAEPTTSGWVRLALRSIFHAQPVSNASPDNEVARVSSAKTRFVEAQRNYHENTLIKRREVCVALLSSAGRWGFRLFIAALLTLAINVAAEGLFHSEMLSPMAHHFMVISQVAGLAFWGAMRKVIDTFAWEQEVQRGELVLNALRCEGHDGERAAIYQAADFFLKDQAAWHALHRSRPIEAATGA